MVVVTVTSHLICPQISACARASEWASIFSESLATWQSATEFEAQKLPISLLAIRWWLYFLHQLTFSMHLNLLNVVVCNFSITGSAPKGSGPTWQGADTYPLLLQTSHLISQRGQCEFASLRNVETAVGEPTPHGYGDYDLPWNLWMCQRCQRKKGQIWWSVGFLAILRPAFVAFGLEAQMKPMDWHAQFWRPIGSNDSIVEIATYQAIDKRHQAIPLPNSSVKQSGGPLFVHLWVGNSSWPEAVCQAVRWAQKVPLRSTTLGFPSPWIQSPAWCLCQVCRKGKPCCFELEANEPVTFQFWHDLCVNMWMETVGDWKAARCGDWVACCVWSTQKPKAFPFLPRSLSSSLWSYPLFWMSNQSVCLSMFHNKEAAHKCNALMLAIQMNSWWSSGSNSFAIHTEPLHEQNQDSSIDQNSIIIIHVYNHW